MSSRIVFLSALSCKVLTVHHKVQQVAQDPYTACTRYLRGCGRQRSPSWAGLMPTNDKAFSCHSSIDCGGDGCLAASSEASGSAIALTDAQRMNSCQCHALRRLYRIV